MIENSNVNVENQILSTLYNEEKSRIYIRKLFPQVFSKNENKELFKILQDIYLKGLPFNGEFVIGAYGKTLPALEFACVCCDSTLTVNARQMEWAVTHLKDLYYLRLSLYMSQRIAVAVNENKPDLITKLAATIPRVHASIFRNGEDSSDHLKKAVDVINSKSEFIPFSTPRAEMLFGGWTRSDISSIGGKSGHNKTTFIAYDAKESIKRNTVNKIIYFSVDEPGEKIARRIIASECDISLSAMRNKTIKLEYQEIQRAIGKIFKDRFILIDDCFDAERIQQAVLDIKPDRFIVDHIQELDYGKDGISDQKVTVASKLLKESARLTNSNGTIVSQVRDKLIDERFEDKIPRPHDFLYASDLRRKSREQTVVYWEYKDKQDNESLLRYFDFIIWKSTYSDTGKIRFIIDPDKATFTEMESKKTSVDQHTEDSVWNSLENR
jgi:replicative DNA helicase